SASKGSRSPRMVSMSFVKVDTSNALPDEDRHHIATAHDAVIVTGRLAHHVHVGPSLLIQGEQSLHALPDAVPQRAVQKNRGRDFDVLSAEFLPSASLHRRQPGLSCRWQKLTLATPAAPRGQHQMTAMPDG